MIADSGESTAQSLETKAATSQATLSDRLTQSLIMSGLVKGIIPLPMRKGCGPAIQALVSSAQDGPRQGEQNQD